MKKFLMLFFVAVLPALCFVGCSDDDDEGNAPAAGSILGKYYDVEYPSDYIELQSDGVAVSVIVDKGEVYTERGTYVYNAPSISISIDGEMASGTISGNTLTLTDSEGYTSVYKKH